MNNRTVFGVRDIDTGKLVSDLTSKSKKFWCTRASAQNAISRWGVRRDLEIVEFALVEIKDGKYNPHDLDIYCKGDNDE